MSSRRSAETRRAHRAARAAKARRSPSRARGSIDALGWFLTVGIVTMYVLLFGSAVAQSAGGAVLASVVAVAWAVGCCVGAHRLGTEHRGDERGGPRRVRMRAWAWLLLPAALVSPAATHWAAGRTRSGSLTFGDADAGVLDAAQVVGWVSLAVVVVGCPTAWLLGRGRADEGARRRAAPLI